MEAIVMFAREGKGEKRKGKREEQGASRGREAVHVQLYRRGGVGVMEVTACLHGRKTQGKERSRGRTAVHVRG